MLDVDHKGRFSGDCPVILSLQQEIKRQKKKVRKLKKKLAKL
jgi:hypothetical protein